MVRLTSLIVATAALAGCASFSSIDSDVTTFSKWPSAKKPSTYAFERLPSQQAQPQQAQVLEDAARPAIEAAGFAPAPAGSPPDVTVQLGARVTAYDRSPFDDPFWYGPHGPFPGSFYYSRYHRGPFWGPGWRYGWGGLGSWGGPAFATPYYEREVAVLIRDRRSGEPLYETRANSDGIYADVGRVLPAMYAAALKDFPQPSTTRQRVRIDASATTRN